MKKYLCISMLATLLFPLSYCYAQKPSDFLPAGYKIAGKVQGDLNNDGRKDLVLIIKRTDKNNIVTDRFGKKADRNRRGIIALIQQKDGYRLASKNYNCFSSENEDGGVYFPPELMVYIKKGNLYIHYAHGRYGYWKYTFRYQNSDLEMIGYDESGNSGPVVNRYTSVNFLTKKKLEKQNINRNAKGGDEVFEETWENIEVERLDRLSEIRSFDTPSIP
ncbi:MAG: hypothetical protein QM594_18910 [Niabella sp.]